MIEAGRETYLGDGLYVSHDNYQICLRAEGQRVFLEPSVWYTLLGWIKQMQNDDFPDAA